MAGYFGGTKQIMAPKAAPAMTAGGGSSNSSGGGRGPTGSSRSYAKGSSKPGDSQNAPFNPRNQAVSTIYVGGV